jgi:hypothetical protein
MTRKQSLTRKQSIIRRSLAVLSAALLTVAWTIGISIPASAAAVKGFLQIVSITDQDSGFGGTVPNDPRPLDHDVLGPVQNRSFNVGVRVIDRAPGEPNPQPVTVSRATSIVLEASAPGELGGGTEAVILRNGSEATIPGATYSELANGVTLSVRVDSGVDLAPDEVTVEVALTVVDDNATRGDTLDLDDPECGAGGGVPTPAEPTCGHLLTKGAEGHVIMSVGLCDGLGPCRNVEGTTALVVTLSADIAHPDPPVTDAHSTMILGCDKVRCGGSGVPKILVFYTFDNNSDLLPEPAPDCPAKGVLGDQDICVDYIQSTRSQGDLYLYVLFNHDLRFHG